MLPKKNIKNQILFDGYMELCYLHPNYFTPIPEALNEVGVSIGEKYTVLRFVSWGAVHDKGHQGFSDLQKQRIVEELSDFGKVFISSEGKLPSALEPYKINLPVNKIHHLLAYASLFYGESATMASECAVLGGFAKPFGS